VLNGNPTLSDIELPEVVDEQVAFWTSHSEYAIRHYEPDSWYLFRVEKTYPKVTHFLQTTRAEWIVSPVDRGRSVHAPDWRDALRRVVK
jgi:hypothetical protein